MVKILSVTCVLGVAATFSCPAQVISIMAPDARSARLRRNADKTILSIELSQNSYLAGEVVRATLSVRNPTNESLEIYDPIHGPIRLTILKKRARPHPETGEEFEELAPEGLRIWSDEVFRDAPTIWLSPGQKIEKRIDICGFRGTGCHDAIGAGHLYHAGHYQILFWTDVGGQLTRAYFEMKDVDIRFIAERPPGEVGKRLPFALVIRSEGQDYVIVNRGQTARDWQIEAVTDLLVKPRALRERAMKAIFPFDRIHSAERIDSLRIEPDPGGRAVVVRWTDDRYGAMGMRIDDERKHFDAVR